MNDVHYTPGYIPPEYKCDRCNKTGVRLWREYQTVAPDLFCKSCAEKNQKRKLDPARPHEIAWLVAAVPDIEGVGYWGYTSVPEQGVKWWDSLHD